MRGALTAACLRGRVQDRQSEVEHLQKQKEELCAQIRDLSLPVHLASESLPDLKKQLRLLEGQAGESAQEVATLSAKIQQQQQVLSNTQRGGDGVSPLLFSHLFFSVIDPHALRDGAGADEADAPKRAGG